MIEILKRAVQNREVLAFTYSGLVRIVEPHAVGISRAGNPVLRCYQVQGGHVTPGHEWDFCEVSQIIGLQATGEIFAGPRPGYRRGDRHMVTIFAEL